MPAVHARVEDGDDRPAAVHPRRPRLRRLNERGALREGDPVGTVFLNAGHEAAHRLQHPQRVGRGMQGDEGQRLVLPQHTMARPAQTLSQRPLHESDRLSLPGDGRGARQRRFRREPGIVQMDDDAHAAARRRRLHDVGRNDGRFGRAASAARQESETEQHRQERQRDPALHRAGSTEGSGELARSS